MNAMNTQRAQLYSRLEVKTSNTRLVEMNNVLPNGNKLFVKLECENAPGFNHYVRIYLALFKHFEEKGLIKPGQRVYDFTSGSAGIAMASLAAQLGYVCEVAMPADGEKARERAILEWIPSHQLHLTDSLAYVDGAPVFSRKFLAKNRDCFFFNHSMVLEGKVPVVNEEAMAACANVVDEALRDMENVTPDVFVAISGNGTTQNGYGRRIKELCPSVKIVGAESFESGFVYDKLYPGRFEEEFGMSLSQRGEFSRHRLPGTSYRVHFDVPALEASLPLLAEEKLVWDSSTLREYTEITGQEPPKDAIVFDTGIPNELKTFGRTTWVSYKVAENLARETEGQSYLIVAYDHANRYDSWWEQTEKSKQS